LLKGFQMKIIGIQALKRANGYIETRDKHRP